jgi:serine/threonine protein kinase
LKNPLISSRYELTGEIGRGGEARVFRAQDIQSGAEVAVRLAAGFRAVEVLAPAPHPGWVRLLDRGTDPKQGAYEVFELLAGETLGAMVRRAPLDPEAWHAFVRQSFDAVEALHAAGWVHGDLNADNFLATPGPVWKLLELPFLRFATPEKRSALFGSIHTLAPEQLKGSPPDTRSDLYALGCLYYYAASGTWPNAGGRAQDIAVARLRFPAEPLREKAPRLSTADADWVMKLLEREPRDRSCERPSCGGQ